MTLPEGTAVLGALAAALMLPASLSWTRAEAAGGRGSRVAIVVGERAPELERFAATELQGYIRTVFGLRAEVTSALPPQANEVFLLGSPANNPAVAAAVKRRPLRRLSDQGITLRGLEVRGGGGLLVVGGSPVATLWGVYELAERWGVRHLLHGDAFPERRAEGDTLAPVAVVTPGEEVVLEPGLPIRQWRAVNDFALGPESWGIADYRPVLDQLARLKFNRLFVNIYPYQPFLHLSIKGVEKRSAHLWYDFHYPITEDMIGRALFPDREEFWNPDLPLHAGYQELAAAGERHVHALMAHAKSRGMQVVIDAVLTEFPPELAPLLPGAQKVHQLGEMGIVPGPQTDVDDPAITDLAAAVLQTTVNTYPEVDYVSLGMPEFRQWAGAYERAWAALDRKYAIAQASSLDQVLAQAEARRDYPGGADRALQEVKGDLVALYLYDRLLTDLRVLEHTKRPDVKLIFVAVAEELFPILPRVLPPGSETMNQVDYTPSRILKRREALRALPGRDVPSTLVYTLHDDNVGVLPQLTTGSLHELTQELRRDSWAGFSTRYWLIGDHDPCVAYLARAAWDTKTTPESVYRDQVRAVCGEACVEEMLTVFREVEATTVRLEWHGLGLTFPVPGMMMKHWTPGPLPPELAEDRESYRRALDAARRARARAGTEEGRKYTDYWVGRLKFGVAYLDTVEHVHRAATAESEGKRDDTIRAARAALDSAREALEAYARVARDRSDLGAIATMNEYVWRPLQAKAAELGNR